MDRSSPSPDSARSETERIWATFEAHSLAQDPLYMSDCGMSPLGVGDERRWPSRGRSPPSVDRYEPGRRIRDDSSRDREHRSRRIGSPPPGVDRYTPGPSRYPLPLQTRTTLASPFDLPFTVGFSYFSEWWRQKEQIKNDRARERNGRSFAGAPEIRRASILNHRERKKEKATIQAEYDAYKEVMQAKMARKFVAAHKSQHWFQERYVPEIRESFRQQIDELRRDAYLQWKQELESGTFDEFSLEGVPRGAQQNWGNAAEIEEGETPGSNEFLGLGDLVSASGLRIRHKALDEPTLLIKTVAPKVSRYDLESFCKDRLGEGGGGFKFLSLSDPNPNKNFHRIGWVVLRPASKTAPIDYTKSTNGSGATDSEPSPPKSVIQKALDRIDGKKVPIEETDEFICHVGIHSPPLNPRPKALWDLFSAPERIDKDLALARCLVKKLERDLGPDFTAVPKIEERVNKLKDAGRFQSVTLASKKGEENRNLDLDDKMDEGENGVDEEGAVDVEMDEGGDADNEEEGAIDEEEGAIDEEEGAIDEEVDNEDLLVKKKQLDMMVEYLRRVFNFCFFCVFESDSIHELSRKCPGGHLRRPRSMLTTAAKEVAHATVKGDPFPEKKDDAPAKEAEIENTKGSHLPYTSPKTESQLLRAYNWVKTFEAKIDQILDPDSVDIKKLGGKPVKEALDEELLKFVKQEDGHKWRCKVPECTKLFKEEHFWRKHVEKRHTQWLGGVKNDFELINAYVLDPAHLVPSRTDASSNGHFPHTKGQVPTGTPRGFNVQNFAMRTLLPVAGGLQVPATHSFVAPPLNPTGEFRVMRIEHRGPGARPSHTGRHQNRKNPYGHGPTGRGTTGGDDGACRNGLRGRGRSPMGPREAVQGRSLKSYEDLDHVAGGGAGELNY